MNAFDEQIGGEQQIVIAACVNHGGIVANSFNGLGENVGKLLANSFDKTKFTNACYFGTGHYFMFF